MKKEYDLSKLKKRREKLKVSTGAAKIAISIRLDAGVLLDLKIEADRLGIPYQTFIGSILHRFTSAELVDAKALDLSKLIKKAS